MKIYTICTKCNESVYLKSSAPTRPDLQMDKGTEFDLECNHCGRTEKKHVNDFRAESNKVVIVIGILLGAIITIILFSFYGAIATITFTIPIIFWQQQMKATKAFNSYLVRRKP
jgi:hypothetical protein